MIIHKTSIKTYKCDMETFMNTLYMYVPICMYVFMFVCVYLCICMYVF